MPTIFQPPPILQVQRLPVRLPTPLCAEEVPADAVVATAPASANTDHDNGIPALPRRGERGRREGAASRWVAATYGEAAGRFYGLQVSPRKLGQRRS